MCKNPSKISVLTTYLKTTIDNGYQGKHLDKLLGSADVYNYFDKTVVNLCQSYYASDFLRTNLGDAYSIELLFEPLGEEYLEYQRRKTDMVDPSRKKDIVLYNPRKGFKYTKLIMAAAEDITFIPIENMTSQDILNMLIEAKVYIDFGPFPGSDRLPRQAACCDCCIITGRFGAANYFGDVSIPDKYKFFMPEREIDDIVREIRNCICKYPEKIQDFEQERQKVANEESLFIEHIRKIFVRI